MAAAGKISVLLESNVAEFTRDEVRIKLADGTVQTSPNQRAFVLIGADTPVAWLETNNVRFVERPHLYTLGASDEVVRRLIPQASECPRTAAESIAMVLGATAQPPPVPVRDRVRSVVGHMRDEIREAVGDLSGVFKISDLDQRARVRTPVGGVPVKGVIPAQRLVRGKTTASQRSIPNDFPIHERTATVVNPFAPERTVVGMTPIRPRSQQKAIAKPAKRPAVRLGFDTSELQVFNDKLPFDEPKHGDDARTELDHKVFRERGANPFEEDPNTIVTRRQVR